MKSLPDSMAICLVCLDYLLLGKFTFFFLTTDNIAVGICKHCFNKSLKPK